MLQAQQRVKRACEKRGIPLIGLAKPDSIHQFLDEKYRMLMIGSDGRIDGGGLKEILDVVRKRH